MKSRIAINGYGRIGQSVLRALYEGHYRDKFELLAINELSDIDTLAYLTRYDTTHGRFPLAVDVKDPHTLSVDGDLISVHRYKQIDRLPWQDHKIDLVMECTGKFGSRSEAKQHLVSGSKKVLFSQPADKDVDKTIVYGLNHTELSVEDCIVSSASCTTNAIVPVIHALNEAFIIKHGTLNTIHSVMNDQPIIDAYHHSDLRRTRSAMHNLVPVDTELAKGIERLLPEMAGLFTATAVRVPTLNVSLIDLNISVERSTDAVSVNRLLKSVSEDQYSNVLFYTEEPLASSDFNHDAHSGIVDGSQTNVSGSKLIKVMVWFDNEWAYANRMLDVASHWLSL